MVNTYFVYASEHTLPCMSCRSLLHTSASHERPLVLSMFVVTASAAATKAEEALPRSQWLPCKRNFNGSQIWMTFVLADPDDCHDCHACCKLLLQWTGLHVTIYTYLPDLHGCACQLSIDPGKICKFVPSTGPAEVASQATTCFRP